MPVRLQEIVARFGGDLVGDGGVVISGVGSLDQAVPGQISFLSNPRFRHHLRESRATAVILPAEAVADCPGPAVVTAQPYLYYARVAQWLHPPARPAAGIHPSAVVDGEVHPTASIGPHAYIADGASVGPRTVIAAGCTVGAGSRIGADGWLHAGAIVYGGCRIGDRAIIHSGAVIGADGFGFARDEDGGWQKIPQLGGVVVGDDVEIGACTTIDRGALADTVIEDGVKLDNQIQVAHNVRIGAGTAIAGCVGIAGSTRIGRGCTIAGAASIIGHLEIADNVHISVATVVGKSITRPGSYTGTVPFLEHGDWLKNFSRLRHLEAMADKIRALETRLAELEKKS